MLCWYCKEETDLEGDPLDDIYPVFHPICDEMRINTNQWLILTRCEEGFARVWE